MDTPDLDTIDDPYRRCEACELQHHEEYGQTCEACDVWICTNCWPEHAAGHVAKAEGR